MKTNLSTVPSSFRQQSSRSGSALLIVLGCVALLTLLIVAFLITARTEYSSSTFYARGVNTKLLSETALNMVMAQISQATKSTDALASTPGHPVVVAWASQPGMIRTFQPGPPDANGNLIPTGVSDYKLYSWDNMATSAANFSQAAEIAPNGWDLKKGIWVDMNEPVQTILNGPIFPILQGTNTVMGINLKTGLTDLYGTIPGETSFPPTGTKSYHFTTVAGGVTGDAGAAANLADVEGFCVNTGANAIANTAIGPAPQQSAAAANQVNPDVPMPVKWIYVLQDGTTVVAQTPGGASNTAASVPGASTANKIVGRIAFWTDDETSKVNINTASEGNFWDVPLTDGQEERTLGVNIPVEGEYQRIAGHPATVCLSSVFGAQRQFFPAPWSQPYQVYLTPGLVLNSLLYGLTPRMIGGGSQFGTKPYDAASGFLIPEASNSPAHINFTALTAATVAATVTPSALGTNANRLYSTIDELEFSPNTTMLGVPPTPTRTVNAFTLAAATPAAIEQAKFFITANSRAPEVTLFNTPRISIWPITWPNSGIVSAGPTPVSVANITTNPYYTNTTPGAQPTLMPEEKLLAFCGTVGGNPYYFQRQNAYDAAWDYSNITRNQQLISYLDAMTTQAVPGFGGSFSGKYGADQAQIITEIFDYIRSAPNLNNTVAGNGGAPGNIDINYDYAPIGLRDFQTNVLNGGTVNNGGTTKLGGGTVVPITFKHNGITTSGAGRYNTITDAALVFYAVDRQEPYDTITSPGTTITHFINYPAPSPYNFAGQAETGAQTTKLGMYLLLNTYNPVTGHIDNVPYFIVNISGSPFSINGSTVDFPNSGGSQTLIDGSGADAGGWSEGIDAFQGICISTTLTNARLSKGFDNTITGANPGTTAGTYKYTNYPFYMTPLSVPNTATTFNFTGSLVTLNIYPVDAVGATRGTPAVPESATSSQTITIDFGQLNGTYPMPVAPRYNASAVVTIGGVPDGTDNAPGKFLAPPIPPPPGLAIPAPPWEFYNPSFYYFSRTNTSANATQGSHGVSDPNTGAAPAAPWGGPLIPWDARNLFARSEATQIGNGGFGPFTFNSVFNSTSDNLGNNLNGLYVPLIIESYNTFVLSADTVISMRLNPSTVAGNPGGDARLLALTQNVPKAWFVPHYATSLLAASPYPIKGAHSLAGTDSDGYIQYENMFGNTTTYPTFYKSGQGALANWVGQNTTVIAGLTPPSGTTNPANPIVGDFCNGLGNFSDGAVIPKVDDTTSSLSAEGSGSTADIRVPYFTYNADVQSPQPYFSPARQLSGPVAFGILPTGVKSVVPWRTLAFNPNPMVGQANHIGWQSPPDHLLLDLFWMPVVEPYAISEPLSTAGKINMNYEIEPFTYINRQTALYAAMKSDRVFAIPQSAGPAYKFPDSGSTTGLNGAVPNSWGFHFPIDVRQTLQQFDAIFSGANAASRIFVSASEICSIYLDPKQNPIYNTYQAAFSLPPSDSFGSTTNIAKWWTATGNDPTKAPYTALTGVNGRQQPYAHLYSLLTTKSNTFQVHMRVQVLAKSSATDPTVFDEGAGDSVVGEYRGSAIIERYVDANDPTLPDFATTFTTAGSNTLDSNYRFRIVSTKAFDPR